MSSRGIRALALAVLSLALPAAALLAVPENPADLKAKVQQLVAQLAIPSKQTAAETELIKLGPDILPFLPDERAKLLPAQQERLKSIRATLQEAQVLRELQPRTVTLQNQAIALSQALDQLRKQTGLDVADLREMKKDDPDLKLDLQKATFWQALDAIAKEADLRVSLYEKEGKVALRDGPHKSIPTSYSGMFRTQVKRISVLHDLESEARFCTVHLEIAWEPRFQPLFIQGKPDGLAAKDDKGNDLKPVEAGGGRNPVLGRYFTEVQFNLEAPRRSAHTLGLLKGSLSVIGPSKMLEFTFDQLAKVDKQTPAEKVPTKTQENVTIKLREFTTESDLWTMSLLLEYPPGGPDFESFESWLVNNKAFLVSKENGKRHTDAGYEIDEQGGNRAVITYRFAEENDVVLGKPENWKLLYRTPGMMARVPIHFEFKDMLLP